MTRRWNTLSDYYLKTYGESVRRIGVDAHFSCPNRDKDRKGGCSFCDGAGSLAVYQRKGEEGGAVVSDVIQTESVKAQVERGLEFVKRRYKTNLIAIALQSFSNTYAPVDKLKNVYDEALSFAPCVEFIVSTRPDCITRENAALLSSYNTKERKVWVELGLQSANDKTLRRINRGEKCKDFFRAAEILNSAGISFSTHIMLMPSYDSRRDYLNTVRAVNESGSGRIKIHNLHVMKRTALEDSYLHSGCLALSSVKRHVEDVAFILAHLSPGIVVDRLLTESTRARLTAPLNFPDKRDVLALLEQYMEEKDLSQGCLV